MPARPLPTVPFFLAVILTGARIGSARPVPFAQLMPVDQVLANTDAWIKTHPKDPEGFRALARLHALAWGYGDKIPLVSAGSPDALPTLPETSTVLVTRKGPGEPFWDGHELHSEARQDRPFTQRDAQHLAASIAAYHKAIELDASDALSELGLAWMIAQKGDYNREIPAEFFADIKPTDAEKSACATAIRRLSDPDAAVRDAASKSLLAVMPACAQMLREVNSTNAEVTARIDATLRDCFQRQALGHYRKAFDLRSAVDVKSDPTFQADCQVSAKAGEQIKRIIFQHPDAANKGEVAAVQQVLDVLSEKMTRFKMMPQ